RVSRKIDPMSACVNGLKPRETRVISNGDLTCHPIFTSGRVCESQTSDVSARAPAVRIGARGQRNIRAVRAVGLAGEHERPEVQVVRPAVGATHDAVIVETLARVPGTGWLHAKLRQPASSSTAVRTLRIAGTE